VVSFNALWEAINEQNADVATEPLLDTGEDSKAMRAIRVGLNLRNEGEGDFWEDFIQVANNNDELANLLGVRPEDVATWPQKIQENLDKIRKKDGDQGQENGEKERNEMMPTGQNGALTFDKAQMTGT